jgi:REP element-mobilizing transposase RayT
MKKSEISSHSKCLRMGRYSETGRIYLLTTKTFQRKPLFLDLFLGRIVVQAMRFQENENRVESLAFVLMPDHLHWLLALQQQSTLSEVMKSVKNYSSRKIAGFLRESGEAKATQVWQEGFHDHALREKDDLIDVARYVVANPLRAGLVQSVGDYSLWDTKWL